MYVFNPKTPSYKFDRIILPEHTYFYHLSVITLGARSTCFKRYYYFVFEQFSVQCKCSDVGVFGRKPYLQFVFYDYYSTRFCFFWNSKRIGEFDVKELTYCIQYINNGRLVCTTYIPKYINSECCCKVVYVGDRHGPCDFPIPSSIAKATQYWKT